MGLFSSTLLIVMALAILVLVVLVIYLVDRFNGLERETQAVIRSLQEGKAKAAATSGPYAGLAGKALWEAVTGQATGELDELTLDGVRKRYRSLIGEHISQVFAQGVEDQSQGLDSPPANTRLLRTPRAQVESWLPPESVETLYRCGQGWARQDPAELPGLRQRLDQASASLLAQAGLEVLQPASMALMPAGGELSAIAP